MRLLNSNAGRDFFSHQLATLSNVPARAALCRFARVVRLAPLTEQPPLPESLHTIGSLSSSLPAETHCSHDDRGDGAFPQEFPPADASNLSDWPRAQIRTTISSWRVRQRPHSTIGLSVDLSERACFLAADLDSPSNPVEHLMEPLMEHLDHKTPWASLKAGLGAGYVQRTEK